MTTTAIWWVRRDLRLRDNQALQAALETADRVVPVFVLDPALLSAPDAGVKRVAFLLGGLVALDADLRARQSRLIVRRGHPERELAELNERIGQMVPERPVLYDPMQMAHVYSAQAVRGCEGAAYYLELAIKEAMPT